MLIELTEIQFTYINKEEVTKSPIVVNLSSIQDMKPIELGKSKIKATVIHYDSVTKIYVEENYKDVLRKYMKFKSMFVPKSN